MSEKLTVAELLARNGRGGSSDDARPRRRRRNLTEGGVSVAELTGSIPVVREEHVSAAADAAANGAVPLKSERSRHAIVAEEASSTPPAAPAVDKVAAGAAPEAPVAPKAAAQEAPEAPAAPEASAEKPAAPEKSAVAKTVAAGAGTAAGVAAAGTAAAQKAAAPEAPEAPAAPEASAEKPAAPEKPAPKPAADKEPTAGNTPAAAAVAADAGASGEKDNSVRPKEFEELEASLADYEVVDYEDNRISWPIMLLQALAAIAGGVGIFLIFNLLWNTISPMICLVLAMIVTLAMIVGVHMLLRHKDKLLMLLAMLVGLVLTIGPRLILGI